MSPLAGKPAPATLLVDVQALLDAYVDERPDPSDPAEQVAFGTSGHRGSSFTRTFNEWHILATTQAICDYRAANGIDGPLFIGRDTHALSEPATNSALEVLVANGVQVMVDAADGVTPTPVISHAILTTNRGRTTGLADGIVVTPSHNPPTDGGFKYNPPNGGPADTSVTRWIQDRANALLAATLEGVQRTSLAAARAAATPHDYRSAYISDLPNVVDVDAVRSAGLHLGADPLGGAAVDYWGEIADRLRLDLTVVNPNVDPTFAFMAVDWDGKIRMDCSSPYAMAGLIGLKDDFDVAFANDTDSDRHGIVTRSAGLLAPNHYLAVAISYLFRNRPGWPAGAQVGKTVVSSSMIDRVADDAGRRLFEVPVGFKWFVDGLLDGSLGFGGEESAGGSFLRADGTTWTTDKDGIILCLLAAEITARTGRDPGQHYRDLTDRFGDPAYRRIDAPATPQMKAALSALTPDQVDDTELAGEPIVEMLTTAPGDGAPIGGLKVIAEHGWFAARPSGTEDVYKVYAESFLGPEHLDRVLTEAQTIVNRALRAATGAPA